MHRDCTVVDAAMTFLQLPSLSSRGQSSYVCTVINEYTGIIILSNMLQDLTIHLWALLFIRRTTQSTLRTFLGFQRDYSPIEHSFFPPGVLDSDLLTYIFKNSYIYIYIQCGNYLSFINNTSLPLCVRITQNFIPNIQFTR